MDRAFQYPPELMNLLIDTIPLLCRSKDDVLLFFRGAGVNARLMRDLATIVEHNRNSIRKHEITRTILTRLNEEGDSALRSRREILKRITEFEDFSSCWPDDRLKAQGLVAQIQKVVNVKDSFARMNQEREHERRKRQNTYLEEQNLLRQKQTELATIKDDLFALFSEPNPHRRGKVLEGVLNSLFKVSDVAIREAFTLRGDNAEGVVEQIDGVIEIDGRVYLVEMKWWNQPVGVSEISPHLVRLYQRHGAEAIIISASKFTEPAVKQCKDALSQRIVILCELEEFVFLIEQQKDLAKYLKEKIHAAIIEKNPLFKPS